MTRSRAEPRPAARGRARRPRACRRSAHHEPAAPAISSATAICVERTRSRPGVALPAQIEQDGDACRADRDVRRPLPPRPPEGIRDHDADGLPVSSANRSRSRRARRRQGSSGRSTSESGSGALEASTPADAQTKPCRVSAMTKPPRRRTIRTDSRRTASTWRGSWSSAISRASGDGSSSSRRTTRLRLGDGLLRDHHDVVVAEVGRLGHQRGEIVALPDLGQALDRSELDHGRPVRRRPAWPQ